MTSNSRIVPLGNIERAVGADRNVRRSEKRVNFSIGSRASTDEIWVGEFSRCVARHEVRAIQLEACSFPFGLVAEDHVPAGFADEEGADPFVAQGAVFVVNNPGGRASAVDVASGSHTWIVLAPLSHLSSLSRALVGFPAALSIVGRESEVGVFYDPADAAGGWIIVVILKDVAE